MPDKVQSRLDGNPTELAYVIIAHTYMREPIIVPTAQRPGVPERDNDQRSYL